MRVLIPHSWSQNMGDLAMLTAAVSGLRNALPGASITALVSHPDFTKQRSDLGIRLSPWPWPLKSRPGLAMAWYPLILISHFISITAFSLTGKRIFLSGYSRPLSEFFDCDLVVSPGGDFISPRYWFITTFSEFLFAKMLGKRVILLSQSIGPFDGFLRKDIARFALRLADTIIVREETSAQNIRDLGLDCRMTADLAFAFPDVPMKRKARDGVVICPKRMDSGLPGYRDTIMRVARAIRERTGMGIVVLPTDTHDLELQAEIASRLPDAEVIREVYPPQRIAEILSDSEFLISSRMHAIILGSLSDTPFFSIGDSFKFRSVLEDFPGGCVADYRDFSEADLEDLMGALERREETRKRIASTLPAVRDRSLSAFDIIKSECTRWGLAPRD